MTKTFENLASTDLGMATSILEQKDSRFSEIAHVAGKIKVIQHSNGFEALLKMIVSQQLSVAAAEAIWKKLENLGILNERKIIGIDDFQLRDLGLSRQKVVYVKELARAALDYPKLEGMETKEVITVLTNIKGIGVWTAECYLIFSLGRVDVFACGDLALQEAIRLAYNHNKRPSEAEVRSISECWKPWRSVAALIFWKYYGVIRNKRGVL